MLANKWDNIPKTILLNTIVENNPTFAVKRGFHIKLIKKPIQNVLHSGHRSGFLIYGILLTRVLTGKNISDRLHMQEKPIAISKKTMISISIKPPDKHHYNTSCLSGGRY